MTGNDETDKFQRLDSAPQKRGGAPAGNAENNATSMDAPVPQKTPKNALASTPPELIKPKSPEFPGIPRTSLKDKYEFLTVVGAGGAGVIYKARQQPLGRLVAVKMIHSHLMTPVVVKRFQHEAKTVSNLSHPNIISVFDFGVSEENQPFMVMDFVEGMPLSDVLNDVQQLTPTITKNIAKQLCDGLAHAHYRGIIHRDLKPSNIMMVPLETGQDLVKILDFGLAKIFYGDEEDSQHLTKTGETVGTPAFMSPEQVMGKSLDQRSDLYSLGCVIYQCIKGHPPFFGETKMETMLMHLNSKPEPINVENEEPLVSSYFESIVMRLLEKHPDARFESMLQLKEALEADDKGLFQTPLQTEAVAQDRPLEKIEDEGIAALSMPLLSQKSTALLLGLFGLVALSAFLITNWVEYGWPFSEKKEETPAAIVLPKAETSESEAEVGQSDDSDFQMKVKESKQDEISCQDCAGITDSALSVLHGKSHFATVNLSNARKITSRGLANLDNLPIKELNLSKTKADDQIKDTLESLVYSNGLSSLEALNLSGTAITDAIMPTLKKLSSLRSLDLADTGVSDAGLKAIAGSPLCVLKLANSRVSDEGMAAVGSLSRLVSLDLSNTGITASGVKHLSSLANLQELSLSHTRITDPALESLTQLKRLTVLKLSGTTITQEGLKTIEKIPALGYIDITNCPNISPRDSTNFAHNMERKGLTIKTDMSAEETTE